MSQFLVVDDEPSICWSIREYLSEDGHAVRTTSSVEEALALGKEIRPDAILLDVRLPGIDGVSGLPKLQAKFAQVPIIVMTAHGDVDVVCRALQAGAFDYLPKPFEMVKACDLLTKAIAARQATSKEEASENIELPAAIDESAALVGRSPAMQRIFRQIALAAATHSPVLITGESGVGKECVARAIHRHSVRRDHLFAPVCIPALNPTLIESELFGHERGAFTGADRSRIGVLENAHQGTVLLDEIADAPLAVQVKLLRALENKEVWPVGSNAPKKIDFRILAATNRRLSDLIEAGEFREDLFYRLSVIGIEVPPLRQRIEDVPLLAEYFLSKFAQLHETSLLQISPQAIEELKQRAWYGNVRELRNCIEHAATLCRGPVVQVEHLAPPNLARSGEKPSDLNAQVKRWVQEQIGQLPSGTEDAELYQLFLTTIEPAMIEVVLGHVHQNRAAAARLLGVHRATLRKMLKGNE